MLVVLFEEEPSLFAAKKWRVAKGGVMIRLTAGLEAEPWRTR